jgi:hypothetical protein
MEAAGENNSTRDASSMRLGLMMRWNLWRRKQREADLEDEIRHDLALEAEERIQSGMPREEAERRSERD